MGRSNIDPVARALALAAAAGGGGGGADAVIIEASANKTVNNYQVPQLTDEQLLQIYNAVVAGKPVTVTDATGSMHFSSLNADSVSGEIFVTMLYFDKMILEYSEGDQTTFTEIGGGGGKLYRHDIQIYTKQTPWTADFVAFSVYSKDASPMNDIVKVTTYLAASKKRIPAVGQNGGAGSIVAVLSTAVPNLNITYRSSFSSVSETTWLVPSSAASYNFTDTVTEL